MWLDLSNYLPLKQTKGDAWAAEKLLYQRLIEAGVVLSPGQGYHSPTPGKFRFVFCLKEDVLREGIKRSVFHLQSLVWAPS